MFGTIKIKDDFDDVLLFVNVLVNGSWSNWSEYSKCSKTCGEGQRQRNRECNNPAPNEYGTQCEGKSVEVISCNNEPCFGKFYWRIILLNVEQEASVSYLLLISLCF